MKYRCGTPRFAMGRILHSGYGYDRKFFIGARIDAELRAFDAKLDDLALLVRDGEEWIEENRASHSYSRVKGEQCH